MQELHRVYMVYNQGEQEDWPLAIFRDKDDAYKHIENTHYKVSEVTWNYAKEWFNINYDDK